jgi:hypothetical protein
MRICAFVYGAFGRLALVIWEIYKVCVCVCVSSLLREKSEEGMVNVGREMRSVEG